MYICKRSMLTSEDDLAHAASRGIGNRAKCSATSYARHREKVKTALFRANIVLLITSEKPVENHMYLCLTSVLVLLM